MDFYGDLHTHTFYSDGVLGPAELARRCEVVGYEGLVISDHVDHSNIEHNLRCLCKFCDAAGDFSDQLTVLPGCEITHVPPRLIGKLVDKARELGAAVVLVHGETTAEPVVAGTNRAAIEAGVDVLAHPGLIDEEDVRLAGENGVLLEISGRKGHCLTNGRVSRLALEHGASLSYGSDGHTPGNYRTPESACEVCLGAGLTAGQVQEVFRNNARFFQE